MHLFYEKMLRRDFKTIKTKTESRQRSGVVCRLEEEGTGRGGGSQTGRGAIIAGLCMSY